MASFWFRFYHKWHLCHTLRTASIKPCAMLNANRRWTLGKFAVDWNLSQLVLISTLAGLHDAIAILTSCAQVSALHRPLFLRWGTLPSRASFLCQAKSGVCKSVRLSPPCVIRVCSKFYLQLVALCNAMQCFLLTECVRSDLRWFRSPLCLLEG